MRYKFLFLFFFAILFAVSASAQEGGGEVVCPPPPSCPGANVWDENQCTSTCKADIQTRRVWEWYTLEPAPSSGDCPAYFCQYHIYRDPWKTIQSCQPWQGCEPQGVLKNTLPKCSCAGTCLETPKNPRYYDNPDYSDKPDKSMPSANVKLPTKFDWDDVEGWLKSPDGPKSYIFKFQDAITKILNKSEYAGLRKEKDACFLKSNSGYSWQAQACCSADGENCGNSSNWNFTVSPAPEIISPEDPDWAGPKGAGNIVITPTSPMKIDWCDIEGANSYRLRVFLEDEKKEKICSPALSDSSEEEQCDSWRIKKERRDPEQLEKILYSDFTDEDLYFFTKDTTYDWEVKMCLDESGGLSGGECKDYSQRWSFTANKQAFGGLDLISPPNDPEGKTPVGLPLVLDWSAPSGMNSFIYQIDDWAQTISQVSQSDVLDIDLLKLNRLYKWKVKACSDFFGSDCESFSQEWTFRTTGRPPALKEPVAGKESAPIPVNLKWEDVPGAKSYIVMVEGTGLSIATTTDNPEFSIDYPEYNINQGTNYSWQVKTCAYEGWTCGSFSQAQTFKTFRLPAPSSPSPENNGPLLTDEKFVSWASAQGAKAYQYQVRYVSLSEKEKDETCPATVGKDIFAEPKTIRINSDFTELKCLGTYQWQARACLDTDCKQTGEWANWTFSLVEPQEVSGKGGLIPCGQSYNNPETPWNDRESCEIKHAFLLIKVIFDFLLTRIVPIILVILTIYSAIIFYFSMGKAAALSQVISLWKSVGIGIVVIAFAWLAVNIFLNMVGYQINIFGKWNQL